VPKRNTAHKKGECDMEKCKTEKCAEEKSYLDMIIDLRATLDTDTMMPTREKQAVIRVLQRIMTILWKYSA